MAKAKRARRSGITHWPQLDDALEKWILEEREKGLPVSMVKIHILARKITANVGILNFNGNSN